MKKYPFLLLGLFVFLFSCTAQTSDEKELQRFTNAFSSINVKVRGDYALFENEDLSTLNYETYLEKMKAEEKASGKDVSAKVEKAEKHYFEPRPQTFIVVIYSKGLNAVICDDASTAFIDSVQILGKKDTIPDLKSFVK